tara:strand:+ start:1092 stop:1817 length:726 start_codon:yes stop_codon:yes gene_type:complete
MKRLSILAMLSVASPALAQTGDGAVLWQSIEEGDTAQEVADKLAAMPEVKRAKVTGKADAPKISIRYARNGIEILDETFKILPQFRSSNLSHIALATDKTCTVDIEGRYERLVTAFQAKYPTFINGPYSRSQLSSVKYDAVEDRPSTASTVMTDGNTVVLFQQTFTRRDPPPRAYSSNKKLKALSDLMATDYHSYYYACSQDGRYRVHQLAIYMSKAMYDAEMADAKEAIDGEIGDAADKL